MNKKNYKIDESDITLVEVQQENELLKRQATMLEKQMKTQELEYKSMLTHLQNKVDKLERQHTREDPYVIRDKYREDRLELEQRISLLEMKLKDKEAQLQVERKKSQKLEDNFTSSLTMIDNKKPLSAPGRDLNRRQEVLKNRLSETKHHLASMQKELRAYKDSMQQFEFLFDKKRGKEEVHRNNEVEGTLLQKIQLMAEKLLNVEKTYKENEAVLQGNIQMIQDEIRRMDEEFEASKAQLVRELNQKQGEIERLTAENEKLLKEKKGFEEETQSLRMQYKRDKSETTVLLKQAQEKIKSMESDLTHNTEYNESNMAYVIVENEKLRKENRELLNKLKNSANPAGDKPEVKSLLKQNTDLKEQVEDAKAKIEALNEEIRALEYNLERQEKTITSNGNNTYGFTGMKNLGQQEMEQELNNLRQLLHRSEQDKSELFKKFKLYDFELSKQEEFFKEEIKKLKGELIKEKGKPENMENTLIDDMLAKFTNIEAKLKDEKVKYEKDVQQAMKMAENKVRILAEELDREGMWFDKEMEKLRKEIQEWKDENKFLANRLQSQNEANEELREEIIRLKKEKDHLTLDVAQRNFIINRQEKQIAELTSRLYKNKGPIPQPPTIDQQPVVKRPSQQMLPKDKDTPNKEPIAPKDKEPQTPVSRKSYTTITRADNISVNISRPSSVGMSVYQDEEELEKTRNQRDFVEGTDLNQKRVLAELDKPIEQLPNTLKPEPGDDEFLPPLDITQPINFQELKKRWKRSLPNSATRSQLLLMILKFPNLMQECILQTNRPDFMIILKSALASREYNIYEFAVVLLSELQVTGFLNKETILKIEPSAAILKSLLPSHPNEDEESILTRITASLSLLSLYEDLKLHWDPEMSRILLDNEGLDTLLQYILSRSQWLRTAAMSVVAYITSYGELQNEIADKEGIEKIVKNLKYSDLTIKIHAARALAHIFKDQDVVEKFLAEDPKEIDDILEELSLTHPQFVIHILEVVYQMASNQTFGKYMLFKDTEFEMIIKIIQEVDIPEVTKKAFMILTNLSSAKETKKLVYQKSSKLFIQLFASNNQEHVALAVSLLHHLVVEESDEILDEDMYPGLFTILGQDSDKLVSLVVYILSLFCKRNKASFKSYVLKNKQVAPMVNVFIHRRDTHIASLLIQIFLEFLTDNASKETFLDQCDIVFAKNMLKLLAHADPKIKLNVLNALSVIMENPMNHRFIARVDIKNMINLLKSSGDLANDLVFLTLKLLSQLTNRDEFLAAFLAEKLEHALIEAISKQLSVDSNLEALSILSQLINSVYGNETAQSLFKMENNFGIEILSRLCIPPTNDNEFVGQSLGVWKSLVDQMEIMNVKDYLISNPIPMFRNMIEIDNNKKGNPQLKKYLKNFVFYCKKDRLLALKYEEAMLKVTKGRP